MYGESNNIIVRNDDEKTKIKYIKCSNAIAELVHDKKNHIHEKKTERGTVYLYEFTDSIAEKSSSQILTCEECEFDREDIYCQEMFCEDCNHDAHKIYKLIQMFIEEINNSDIVCVGFIYHRIDDVVDIMQYVVDSWGDYRFIRNINGEIQGLGGCILDFAIERLDKVMTAIISESNK